MKKSRCQRDWDNALRLIIDANGCGVDFSSSKDFRGLECSLYVMCTHKLLKKESSCMFSAWFDHSVSIVSLFPRLSSMSPVCPKSNAQDQSSRSSEGSKNKGDAPGRYGEVTSGAFDCRFSPFSW